MKPPRMRVTRALIGAALAPTLTGSLVLAVSTAAPATGAPATATSAATTTAAATSKTPNVAKLAGPLTKQKLTWEKCDFGDPWVNETLNRPNVACATVTVPQDWHTPKNGKTWKIRISQAKNRDVKDGRYKGTMLVNPGGPGGTGLEWGPAMQVLTPDLTPYYNFVGFDPRGVGQSSHATCEITYTVTPSEGPFGFTSDREKELGQTCSANAEVRTINTEQTAYDMDFIRHLLKAPKVSYVGYSYGTWLGTWYANIFGGKYGDKFLLDSALDVTEPTMQTAWEQQPRARDRQFSMHLMNYIARNNATYGLGTDPAAIRARYFERTKDLPVDVTALIWLFSGGYFAFLNNQEYPVAAEVVKELSTESTQEGSALSKALKKGDVSSALIALAPNGQRGATMRRAAAALAKVPTLKQTKQTKQAATSPSTATDPTPTPTPTPITTVPASEVVTEIVDDPFVYVQCNDGQWTQGENYWKAKNAEFKKKAPFSAQLGLFEWVPECAYWPTNQLMPVADKRAFPKSIVINSELDSQTAWEGARHAGVTLPNTSFLAIDNEGTHAPFPYLTEEVDRPVLNFFLRGTRLGNITVAQGKPLPEETETYESWSKLDGRARHIGPVVTDPWTPTESSPSQFKGTSRAARATNARLKTADSNDQLLKQQVRRIYGVAGLKALQDAKVLRP